MLRKKIDWLAYSTSSDAIMTPVSLAGKSQTHQVLRTLLLGLGWFGAGLMLMDWLCESMPFETLRPALRDGFNQVRSGLFLLWPLAVATQLWDVATTMWSRWLLAGLVVAGTVWLALNQAFTLAFENTAEWTDTRILYQKIGKPQVRIVVQRLDMGAMGGASSRVVKLTPVFNAWQLIEPVDTLQFNVRGWQRQ